jgi:hypothetical protein
MRVTFNQLPKPLLSADLKINSSELFEAAIRIGLFVSWNTIQRQAFLN